MYTRFYSRLIVRREGSTSLKLRFEFVQLFRDVGVSPDVCLSFICVFYQKTLQKKNHMSGFTGYL